MEIDNLTLCYTAIQRIYRNAVVRHFRELLEKKYPEDHIQRISKLFKPEEWERIKEASDIPRDSGELECNIIDDYDRLSVNHFYNIFDKFYADLVSDSNSERKNEKNRPKQVMLSWVKEIKNIRDPLSHAGEKDFHYFDVFRVLDSARRVLFKIKKEEEAKRIEKIMEEAKGGNHHLDLQKQPLEDQLPPKETIVSSFVGRGTELKKLSEWFADPLTRRWALSGEGGKGKTAIAYEFARRTKLEAPDNFVTVLWISAKRRKFVEGKTVEINKVDFFDLDSALTILLAQYGWIDDIKKPINEKREILMDLFNNFPCLLIVDDIDSIDQENEEVIEFFSFHVPQTKSKVLFTSRRILFGMGASTTNVGSLSFDDAELFISSVYEKMIDKLPPLGRKDIQKLISVTDGSPLYLEDLLRFSLSVSSIGRAVEMWSKKSGNEARKYALQREIEMLSGEARAVLIAASLNENKISFPELTAITKLTDDQISSALQELQKLFLIAKPALVDGEHYFELNINTGKLVKEVFGADDLYRRLKSSRDALELGASDLIKGQVGAIIRQALAFARTKDNEAAEKLLLTAIEKFRNSDLVGVLGVVYKRWEPQRVADARIRFEEAYKLGSRKEDTYEHWCRMEGDNLEWTRAIKAAQKGIKKIKDSKLLNYLCGYYHCRLAKEMERSLQYEKAKKNSEIGIKYFSDALTIKEHEKWKDKDLDLKILRGKVIGFEILGDFMQVKKNLKAWGSLSENDPDLKTERIRISYKFNVPCDSL